MAVFERRALRPALWVACLVCALGCGRTPLPTGVADGGGVGSGQERCDRRDDDGDGQVDEDFRDAAGRYLDDAHCGACGRPCQGEVPHATALACELLDGTPSCVAAACEPGYARSATGRCIDVAAQLCVACVSDLDCEALQGARCVSIGGLPHCTVDCGDGCPAGYDCGEDDLGAPACLPPGGDCRCDAGEAFDVACMPPGLPGCIGQQRCEAGVRSACELPEERCDRIDNDCDGLVDEGFAGALGLYGLRADHCGACGVDCNAGLEDSALSLGCGGDPFAPSCVVACVDIADGRQPGDLVDADRVIDNGCECRVLSLEDTADDGSIDANCDGADGVIERSVYVRTDGDDAGPGSPSRPLRTIGAAIELASGSLAGNSPRPDVYVGAGTYGERLRLRQGVHLHGGYRGDFLSRSAGGFEVHVVAPAEGDTPLGAALVADGVSEGTVEGMRFTGVDAVTAGAPAAAVTVYNAGPGLVLRGLRLRSGRPGAGAAGDNGDDGQAPTRAAAGGDTPRAALEDAQHVCIAVDDNRTTAGAGGANRCPDGAELSGGDGGDSACPSFGQASGAGSGGNAAGAAAGGAGGLGGRAILGPLGGGASCSTPPCCGLADFFVAGNNDQALPGAPGTGGGGGLAGSACVEALGRFTARQWQPGAASGGSAGRHGAGGGGGGAGGGAEFQWNAVNGCSFADGLGGAGGGGGAGGCGGREGRAGSSGGPAIGVLVWASQASEQPTLVDNEIISEQGARGGDGGAGGDGGDGGAGGPGGDLPKEQRLIPTLSGPQRGERGGAGGDGGPGGSGGGGCGGASIGIWVAGGAPGNAAYAGDNRFQSGGGGDGGRGGGGPVPARDGSAGRAVEVLVR